MGSLRNGPLVGREAWALPEGLSIPMLSFAEEGERGGDKTKRRLLCGQETRRGPSVSLATKYHSHIRPSPLLPPPPPPNHRLTPSAGLSKPPPDDGRAFSSSLLPIHFGFFIPCPISWNHLGVSVVSIVFFIRWPRLWKKFSSSGSVSSGRRDDCPSVLRLGGLAAADEAPGFDGDVANGVVEVVLSLLLLLLLLRRLPGTTITGAARPAPSVAPDDDAPSRLPWRIDVPLSSRSIRPLPSRHDPVP